MEIKYTKNIETSFFASKNIIGFLGEEKDLLFLLPNLEEQKIKFNSKVKRIINKNKDDFNMLGLKDELLNKKISELSSSEFKLICLIKTVYELPKVIVLNNFDLGLNSKQKSKLSKYLKTINALYKINFVIISNDLLFVNKNTKHIIITKNKIIKYQGDLINALKQNLVEKPPIIEFIDMANEKGANLEYTLDNKELLKAIYRSVF